MLVLFIISCVIIDICSYNLPIYENEYYKAGSCLITDISDSDSNQVSVVYGNNWQNKTTLSDLIYIPCWDCYCTIQQCFVLIVDNDEDDIASKDEEYSDIDDVTFVDPNIGLFGYSILYYYAVLTYTIPIIIFNLYGILFVLIWGNSRHIEKCCQESGCVPRSYSKISNRI